MNKPYTVGKKILHSRKTILHNRKKYTVAVKNMCPERKRNLT